MVRPPSRETLERRIGETVKSRYRITHLIGLGGQGAVYRATDLRDRDEVAVKVLHDAADRDSAARERMIREARALMALSGSAVARVLDQGFSADGRLCLITELLHGEDLDENLRKMEAQGLVFVPIHVRRLFGPIVDTLERAHALDIVHRDLKPENVFLEHDPTGLRVRLMDFGFAKFSRLTNLTSSGFVAGSPSYIAPETWLEKPTTRAVDVYGLGATMFRTLAGQPPFGVRPVLEMYRLATKGPRPSLREFRPDLPPEVDLWAQRVLAIEPDDRYPSPRAAYEQLVAALRI